MILKESTFVYTFEQLIAYKTLDNILSTQLQRILKQEYNTINTKYKNVCILNQFKDPHRAKWAVTKCACTQRGKGLLTGK